MAAYKIVSKRIDSERLSVSWYAAGDSGLYERMGIKVINGRQKMESLTTYIKSEKIVLKLINEESIKAG